jgi:hypothetical protein
MTAATTITVHVPLTTGRRPGRKTVVTPSGLPGPVHTRADPALVKALARAHRWKRMLEEGRHASISEMAVVEKIDRGYLGQILQLTLLAPDLIEALLDGTQPADLALPALLKPFPAAWEQQRAGWCMWGRHEDRGCRTKASKNAVGAPALCTPPPSHVQI